MLYLALIYLNVGQREGLRRYESLARPVFHRHGGRFERVLSPSPERGCALAVAGHRGAVSTRWATQCTAATATPASVLTVMS